MSAIASVVQAARLHHGSGMHNRDASVACELEEREYVNHHYYAIDL